MSQREFKLSTGRLFFIALLFEEHTNAKDGALAEAFTRNVHNFSDSNYT